MPVSPLVHSMRTVFIHSRGKLINPKTTSQFIFIPVCLQITITLKETYVDIFLKEEKRKVNNLPWCDKARYDWSQLVRSEPKKFGEITKMKISKKIIFNINYCQDVPKRKINRRLRRGFKYYLSLTLEQGSIISSLAAIRALQPSTILLR